MFLVCQELQNCVPMSASPVPSQRDDCIQGRKEGNSSSVQVQFKFSSSAHLWNMVQGQQDVLSWHLL